MSEIHGIIRIPSRLKCPKCSGKFVKVYTKNIYNTAYKCPVCLTTPGRYYLDMNNYSSKRVRIFRDGQGKLLDTFQRAVDLLIHINYEIDNHIFDPTKYIKSEQKEFYSEIKLNQYLDYKIDKIAPSNKTDYKRHIIIAKEFFNTKDVREIRKIDLINYQEYLQQNFKVCNKTVKNIMDAFKAFLNYCKTDLEILSIVPKFPDIEYETKLFKWLLREDQIRLFEFVPDKHKPIFSFLMLHGCRPSEARALRCRNVDLESCSFTISATFSGSVYREKRKGKKSKPVTSPLHSELYSYMSDRVRNNLPEAFVFVNPSTGRHYCENKLRIIFNDVRVKAGIDSSLRLYDATRHSFASNLGNTGTSDSNLSKLLGHSPGSKMTERYTHSGVENLRVDIEKLSLKRHQTVSKDISYAKK